MNELPALLLALAVSLDSLGVGLSYGVKKVWVPLSSLFLLSALSSLAMLTSMLVGRFAGSFLSAGTARILGGLTLIGLGFFTLLTAKRVRHGEGNKKDKLLVFRLRPLGLVVQVIRDPDSADLDQSGEISAGEAMLLGTALALDSLGAGFGAALTSLPPFSTSCLVGLATLSTLKVGLALGRRLMRKESTWVTLAHGVLLVLLGFYRLF
jgi:putative sporulation protein YtaF